MTKSAMVQALAGSKSRNLNELAEQVEALQVTLQSSLAVMQATQSDVQAIPAKFQELMELQMATMGEVMDEITRILPPMVESKLTPLVEAIAQANQAATEIQAHAQGIAVTVAELAKQNQELGDLSVLMRESATAITDKADRDQSALLERMEGLVERVEKAEQARIASQPSAWRLPAILVACALAALIGERALSRLVPPSDVQANSALFTELLSKSNKEDRALLNQILDRPAK